mmetsp:Transcript_13943/g.28815  ORF Transcript_13943/g.28815 Transcript_13943/m.28815 type:complete len:115 (-) Transcript_13943:442-786(-)
MLSCCSCASFDDKNNSGRALPLFARRVCGSCPIVAPLLLLQHHHQRTRRNPDLLPQDEEITTVFAGVTSGTNACSTIDTTTMMASSTTNKPIRNKHHVSVGLKKTITFSGDGSS